MEIKVSNIENALYMIENRWPTKVISLVPDNMPDHGIESLHLRFDDIARPTGGYIHPTMGDLYSILKFANNFSDEDRVLIHCHAGISRSTAAAIAVLMQRAWTYEEAYNYIRIIRPVLCPNRLIIQYIDEHFKLDGKLSKLVEENERFVGLLHLLKNEEEEV